MFKSIWIGFDPRETAAFAVCRLSLAKYLTQVIPVRGLVLDHLIERGIYHRPMEWRKVNGNKVMWDIISGAPMSTQHANARFLVPYLAKSGWALFCDGDILYRSNVARLFEELDPKYALYCVKHNHQPKNAIKMDGQVQTKYSRKNWSSFMIFNCQHEANRKLTLEMVNTLPGRDLHRFCWLEDEEIGELPAEWNWLVGHSDENIEPKAVHFTDGVPDMAGYENVPYADEWRKALNNWGC